MSFQQTSHSERSDYSPNGNHQASGNGNGHGKIFSLKPATDPDTLSILDARRNALAEPNARLNRSMKAFFCEILDRALNPAFFDSKGVVTISDSVIGQVFGVSTRTVYTWKGALVAAGYVWLTQKFKTNMWPITQYHLSCLHRPREERKTDTDGTYGKRGSYRPRPEHPGQGARRPGQPDLPLPGSRQTPPNTENADLLRTSGETGKILPVRAEASFGSEPKPASGESRSQLRVRAEASFGSEPKPASGESRSALPVRAEADCQHLETQIGGKEALEVRGGDTPPDLAFEKWIKQVERMLPSHVEKLRAQFELQLKRASTDAAKSLLKRKLATVTELLDGPSVPEAPKPKAKAPDIIQKIVTRQPTPEEIADGEAFMAERKTRKVAA